MQNALISILFKLRCVCERMGVVLLHRDTCVGLCVNIFVFVSNASALSKLF